MAIGRYPSIPVGIAGKEIGETALLRDMLDVFDGRSRLGSQGDVAVFDRYYCSFMMLALLSLRGVHGCASAGPATFVGVADWAKTTT